MSDRGGQNGAMPGRDKKKDTTFKKPSDDKKGTPRANMVSDKEHIQAEKRFAGFHSKRSGTFNLYQAGEDQEVQDGEDTGYHSYFMQTEPHHHEDHTTMNIMAKDFFGDNNDFIIDCGMKMQNEEPEELATVLAMTQDELDQAHGIFMISTVEQQLHPEEILAWRPEELEEFKQLILTEDPDLANNPELTDTKMDASMNGHAENTPSMTWEETDSHGVQLQSASCEWEQFESQEDAGNSPTFSEKGRYAEWVQDMKEVAEWDMENLAQQYEKRTATQAAPKLHIVMMDCGNGPKDPDNNEYSSLDQFQEISTMLAEMQSVKYSSHTNWQTFSTLSKYWSNLSCMECRRFSKSMQKAIQRMGYCTMILDGHQIKWLQALKQLHGTTNTISRQSSCMFRMPDTWHMNSRQWMEFRSTAYTPQHTRR
jgi:hypothetical protein